MSISSKLADVKKSMPEPKKSGHLNYANHDYSTRSDLFEAIRGELAERGVDWEPEAEVVDVRPVDGGIMAIVSVELKFIDAESGETSTCKWVGQSISNDDKSVASASTQAVRFALTNKFMVCDDMVEAMHGQTSSQNNNINRETSSSNQEPPFERIKRRVQDLEFSKQQFAAFGDEIAKREGVNSKSDIPDSRLALWADRLEKADDDKAREKIMKLIGDQAA